MLVAQNHIRAGRVKDFKTSTRYLALALGKTTPDDCQEEDFLLSPSVLKDKIETYFGSLSKVTSLRTIHNTRTNLNLLFRKAREITLLSHRDDLPVPAMKRKGAMEAASLTSPFNQRWHATHATCYKLAPDDWPVDIQEAWKNYCVSRQLKVRTISSKMYTTLLGRYIGFLITIEGLSIQWDDLFDVSNVDRFIRWQSERSQTTITVQSRRFVETLFTVAAQTDHPSLPALKRYKRDLPTPESMHDKREHWITLRELEAIGLSLLKEAHKPITSSPKEEAAYQMRCSHPGLSRAIKHQMALILRLMIRVPLRSRNIREMQLGRNLYQDDGGHWQLYFRGSELKVSTRNRKTNTYEVDLTDYCPDLIPHLEEFLKDFRPRIPQPATTSYVFASRFGNMLTRERLRHELATLVLCHTDGKTRFYPHLIRTIWATEYLTAHPGDYDTAAYMLGDSVQMVMQRYKELPARNQQKRGSQFLIAALR